MVHPRTYGNFARLLGKYVREERVLPLEAAVHRLTGLPAARLGLKGRGRLAPGCFADVVVFDPDAHPGHSTFAQVRTPTPRACAHVFVNGRHTLRDGEYTGAKAGRFVRGPGYRCPRLTTNIRAG
jgi:N-acyl-D-amino-acid deacylase